LNIVLFTVNTETAFKISSVNNSLQIVFSALFGLIPNCAASITIIESFLRAGLSFGAAIAGLSSGAGFGPIVLLKDSNLKTSVKVLLICLIISMLIGFIVSYIFPGIKV
jgi:hypothetical protein